MKKFVVTISVIGFLCAGVLAVRAADKKFNLKNASGRVAKVIAAKKEKTNSPEIELTKPTEDPAADEKIPKETVKLPNETITFNKHIAPILNKNCVECHRTGDVGPFALQSYADAAKRAEFIYEITADRRMPPYHADPHFGSFKDVRQLTDLELAMIESWSKNGTPEGDKKDLPEPPKFTDGWQFGEPDLILDMPGDFTIPAASRDIYRCFVIPTNLTENRTVAAVEFRPGNRRVVHHAILYLDDTGTARRKDEADPGMGYGTFGGIGFFPSGGLGGWAPGVKPRKLPDGFGKYLAKNSDLVLQVHYHPSGKEEKDRSQVGIYFTKEPAKRIVSGIALFETQILIKPNDDNYIVKKEVTIPCDLSLINIWPHMHLLGREMKVTAKLPDGRVLPLLWVKDWDFNWQDGYEYKEPVKLPKGTVVNLISRYDNSDKNPQNPNSPPNWVAFGEQTTNEMCLCTLQVYPDDPKEMDKINALPFSKLGVPLGGGYLPKKSATTDRGERARQTMRNIQEFMKRTPAQLKSS